MTIWQGAGRRPGKSSEVLAEISVQPGLAVTVPALQLGEAVVVGAPAVGGAVKLVVGVDGGAGFLGEGVGFRKHLRDDGIADLVPALGGGGAEPILLPERLEPLVILIVAGIVAGTAGSQ